MWLVHRELGSITVNVIGIGIVMVSIIVAIVIVVVVIMLHPLCALACHANLCARLCFGTYCLPLH